MLRETLMYLGYSLTEESRVNSKKKDWSTRRKEEEKQEEKKEEGMPTTSDGYLLKNNPSYK
jgi:hypothetical protein